MSLSKPEQANSGGIYYFHWLPEGLRARLNHLSERAAGDVLGEITIESERPGEEGHIHQSRFTLTSASSRRTVAKLCEGRAEDIDWDALIEQVCVHTLEKVREGEPLILVGSMPPRETPVWRLHPFLREKQANLIYGAGGSGKSEMAYFMALLIQTGEELCSLSPIKGNVLFLDWETSPEEADDRIQALKRGMAFDEEVKIAYRFCYQPLAADIVEIQRMVLETKAELVIADSVGMAMGTDSERWDTLAFRYFRALRSLRVTTLSIDHIAKDKPDTPFGSIYKYNTARNIFEIKQVSGPKPREINVGFFHRKINSGELVNPQGFRILFEGEGAKQVALVERIQPKTVPGLVQGGPLVDRIANVLLAASKMLPYRAIADELGSGENTIKAIVNREKHRFAFSQEGRHTVIGVKSFEEEGPP